MRLVMKDLPLGSHRFAQSAAEAARCAASLGKFWPYHDRLFENQPAFDRDRLVDYAAEVGLARDPFAQCLDSHRFETAVRTDVEEARALGVTATPTFFINGKALVGAHPVETFRAAVDEALAAAKTK